MPYYLSALAMILFCLPAGAEEIPYEDDEIFFEAPIVDEEEDTNNVPIDKELEVASPEIDQAPLTPPKNTRTQFISTHLIIGQGQETGKINFVVSNFKDEAEVDVDWQKLGIHTLWATEIQKSWLLGIEGEVQYYRLQMADFRENAWGYSLGLYGGYEINPSLRVDQTYFVQSKIQTDDSSTSGHGAKTGLSFHSIKGLSFGLHYNYLFYNKASFKNLDSKAYDTQLTGFQVSLGYHFNL